jgi:putative toxin-antitoxin system antitoxin component (TIGR02293 family)
MRQETRMAGKVRAIKLPAKSKSKRAGAVSAKSLKARASQLALAASPLQYLGVKQGANLRLSRLVTEGLSTDAAETLAGNLDLSASEFTANYLLLPKQTLARRKTEGKLTTAESDRVLRFARLLKQATDMMEGDKTAAIRWLKAPQVLLENQTPLEFARTESGALEVQQLIGRIEAGVLS